MKVRELDTAIWHVIPDVFADPLTLEYRDGQSRRAICLTITGSILFFDDELRERLPDWAVPTLKQAYKDLAQHGHFVFEEETCESSSD